MKSRSIQNNKIHHCSSSACRVCASWGGGGLKIGVNRPKSWRRVEPHNYRRPSEKTHCQIEYPVGFLRMATGSGARVQLAAAVSQDLENISLAPTARCLMEKTGKGSVSTCPHSLMKVLKHWLETCELNHTGWFRGKKWNLCLRPPARGPGRGTSTRPSATSVRSRHLHGRRGTCSASARGGPYCLLHVRCVGD